MEEEGSRPEDDGVQGDDVDSDCGYNALQWFTSGSSFQFFLLISTTVYKVVPTEQMQGLIEFVSDAVTVCKVQLLRRPEMPRMA